MLKTWLCANLGVVYVACALILLGIAAIFLPVSFKGDDHALWLIAAIGIGCVSFVFLLACEPTVGPIFSIIALVGMYIFFIYYLKNPENGGEIPTAFIRGANSFVISLSLCSIVPAFFIARYAYINFDDVVSRRWLYRNSEKDVFETTWKYTINRFFMAFLMTFCLLVDIAIIVLLTVIEHNDGLPAFFN